MITQKLPFLIPLRVAQRKLFFYTKMRFDGRTYAKTIRNEPLRYKVFSAENGLYNANTGFEMIYQENKVFNLKLVAETLNGLLIKPGETFSFWQAARNANKQTPYKDGLVMKNGKLCVSNGGGLCQMSNLLFWIFLHSPLSIAERHTHRIKSFPTMRNAEPDGVDATVSEGWLDLKVENNTNITFQICLGFDSVNVTGSFFTDKPVPFIYEIEGKDLSYFRKNGAIYQKITIYRREIEPDTRRLLSEIQLYENLCRIGYQLPEHTQIAEERG